MQSAKNVPVEYVDPLPGFNSRQVKGTWIYEGTNPFPATVPALEASTLLTRVVNENKEVILRDRTSGKVILAVYRNRIGPDALALMRETIIEMMTLRRKIARSKKIVELNQGAMTAAGYVYIFNLGLIFLFLY